MEKQSLNQPEMGFERPQRAPSFRRSWQMMFFNEYGRTIRINHLQRYLIAVGVLITILLLATLCLAGLYMHERSKRMEVQTAYSRIQDKVSSLMSENDALMARLAVLYDKIPQSQPDDGAASGDPETGEVQASGPAPQENTPVPGLSLPSDGN